MEKERKVVIEELEYPECYKCVHRYWWMGEWRCHLHHLAREEYCPHETEKQKRKKKRR